MVQPKNSCDIYMMKPRNTSGLHPHEPSNNILINTTTLHAPLQSIQENNRRVFEALAKTLILSTQ